MNKVAYTILIIALSAASIAAGELVQPSMRLHAAEESPAVNEEMMTQSKDDDGAPSGAVSINYEKQQLIGVRIGKVEQKPVSRTLRLLGKVAPDENSTYAITATVEGLISKTFPNSTGSMVKKDEVLATLFSQEFLSPESALLFALGQEGRAIVKRRNAPPVPSNQTPGSTSANIQQYMDTLKYLGIGDKQIEEMIRANRIIKKINITSPSDGFIIARNIYQGLRFDKGWEFYRIADLRRVWVLADVYESEAESFRPGVEAKVFLPYRKKNYPAKTSAVLPVFDPTTRTLKVRLEMENPDFALRPDMFVDVELPVAYPPGIYVPADAVLHSGLRKTVFVLHGEGRFEPRRVETGRSIGRQIEIIKGLHAGEEIVTSGNFLIDSESKLELAAAGMSESLSNDPVCEAPVSARKAERQGLFSTHLGETYYFCSDECRNEFEREPGRYVEGAGSEAKEEPGKESEEPAKLDFLKDLSPVDGEGEE